MIDAAIYLIGKTMSRNADGGNVETETAPRLVMCSVKSVGRADFYQAAQAGLDLSYVFTMQAVNYMGEKIVEYQGQRYDVARTYQATQDTIELYVGVKVGVSYGLNTRG